MLDTGESWDLFTQELIYVRPYQKGTTLPIKGLYHKTVEIIPTDMKGHLLLTKRSPSKCYGGDKYEFPAGSVLAGETELKAALRELMEETGLQPRVIYPLTTKRPVLVPPVARNLPGMARYTFLAHIPDLTTQKIRLQDTETCGYMICTIPQWNRMRLEKTFLDRHWKEASSIEIYGMMKKLVGVIPEKKPAQTKAPNTLRRAEGLIRNPTTAAQNSEEAAVPAVNESNNTPDFFSADFFQEDDLVGNRSLWLMEGDELL